MNVNNIKTRLERLEKGIYKAKDMLVIIEADGSRLFQDMRTNEPIEEAEAMEIFDRNESEILVLDFTGFPIADKSTNEGGAT